MRANQFCVAIVVAGLWLAGCSGLTDYKHSGSGGGGTQTGSITLSPAAATVSIFGTQVFTAAVSGLTNSAVTWKVNGVTGGSVTTGLIANGTFVAPHSIDPALISAGGTATVTITAVSQADSAVVGTATVTLRPQQQNAQNSPVDLGTSGGNVNDTNNGFCCGGTLGSLVTRNGNNYILSNNHVLAKSDSGITGSGSTPGDPISQPGTIDSPTTCTTTGTSTVANLSEFFNLETGPTPKVDAALAQIVSGQVDPAGNILLLGATQTNGTPDPGAPHSGTGVAATVGQAVAKSGRTTGLTCSTVLATNISANVDYFRHCGDTNKAFTVSYTNLVSISGGSFSAGGDSGSLIVTQSTADPVALLFGGSDVDTVGNPVSDVLAAFPGAGNVTPTFVGGAVHQVIGCTLPLVTQSVTPPQVSQVAAEALKAASAARDLHAPELLANTAIHAIGLGKSYDHPGQAAVLLFVARSASSTAFPRSLQGVPTRVIEGDAWSYRGMLSDQETAQMVQAAAVPQLIYELRAGEMERAKTVHTAHAQELLKNSDVLGVGISSSIDSPGEAALLIYVKRGAPQTSLPLEIDGVRTRFRESGPFVAGRDGVSGNAARECRGKSILPVPLSNAKL